MNLEQALEQFEKVETNLSRIDALWEEMEKLVPQGISFADASPEARRYEDFRRAYADLLTGLPPLDGYVVSTGPQTLDEIAAGRMDAADVGEPEISISVAQAEGEHLAQLAEYKHRFKRARRALVRGRVRELMSEVDGLLATVDDSVPSDSTSMADNEVWQGVDRRIGEIERLVAADLTRSSVRWPDLERHRGFAQGCDLHDIAKSDWPAVKPDIEASLYSSLEPLPIDVADLGTLVAEGPTGTVSTALAWDTLDDEDFERLIYNLFVDARGYENPLWLTNTNAPDRGRDLSVERIVSDSLGDTRRERVIVQCRHWLARSTSDTDCAAAVTKMSHWEPPTVDVLIIATSGRFTSDGISWIEDHNQKGKAPRVEMWAVTRLETQLALRPAIIQEFGLRPS